MTINTKLSSSPLLVEVDSANVRYTSDTITSDFAYESNRVERRVDGSLLVRPQRSEYTFCTQRSVPRVGVLLVGWGGNNGSTLTAGVLANKHALSWQTKTGWRQPDYLGSLTQASTLRLGEADDGEQVHVPMKDVLPMLDPNEIVLGGWDINGANLADAMERAAVLDIDLQRRLRDRMALLKPMPSIYYPDFIATNQEQRVDNAIDGGVACDEHLDRIRSDIRAFKRDNSLDKVIVLWTANTERFCDVVDGVHDTAANLLNAISHSHSEVSPSTVFAVASILEQCSYINGSPQNTLVPGVLELAQQNGVFVGGDDFKTGQTKIKSVLVDFLVGAGIKPVSIVSYNHLGNNDGKNLSAPRQFRSKEISKSSVVDDMVLSNRILYPNGSHDAPDHTVVIKYVPYVGDSKRALDEYVSEIFLGGHNTISMHNTCEDSLLAAPLILDLVILTELFERVSFRSDPNAEFEPMHSVLSVLSYLLKAPMVPAGTPVVNALFKQRACIENIMRACLGLQPEHHMMLEHKQRSAASRPTVASGAMDAKSMQHRIPQAQERSVE